MQQILRQPARGVGASVNSGWGGGAHWILGAKRSETQGSLLLESHEGAADDAQGVHTQGGRDPRAGDIAVPLQTSGSRVPARVSPRRLRALLGIEGPRNQPTRFTFRLCHTLAL